MSSFEDFKQSLAPEQLQIFEARIASDREQYEKVTALAQDVANDNNSRLPFIPLFYRTRPIEQEKTFLETSVPRMEAARADQYCLSVCNKEGPACLQECKSFALKAFEIGNQVFGVLHKPYAFSSFAAEAEE